MAIPTRALRIPKPTNVIVSDDPAMAHDIQSDGRVHGVIFGCRRSDGRWLMVRRSRHVAILPLKVCFPGGGRMIGETPEAACIREAHEELGVTIKPLKLVWEHAFPDRPMTLSGYLAELVPGPITPEPAEIAEVLWLSKDEAFALPDGLPTNVGFLNALESACGAAAFDL
jgi:8-oxo-dGTP diphosphatase